MNAIGDFLSLISRALSSPLGRLIPGGQIIGFLAGEIGGAITSRPDLPREALEAAAKFALEVAANSGRLTDVRRQEIRVTLNNIIRQSGGGI